MCIRDRVNELEHHNMAATATPQDPQAIAGKLAFESKCLACHSIGAGKKLGPDLAGVSKRRSETWITNWLKSPEKMLQSDPVAQALLKESNNLPMPNQNLTEAEIKQFSNYLQWVDAQPSGTVQVKEMH